jgi:hypothetical protein
MSAKECSPTQEHLHPEIYSILCGGYSSGTKNATFEPRFFVREWYGALALQVAQGLAAGFFSPRFWTVSFGRLDPHWC